ncbi:putative DIOXYGENASE domain protein [Mycobacterium kansasii]|uniref:Putative DIOXYGENASE domain protein n=1 Tax=Mycobacterium kansasii TaxID=1768 RepID=A0A1V3WUR5_MYCKA|nr:putative DIOXYGENASE domain protein [Mycobacterium kansasii]
MNDDTSYCLVFDAAESVTAGVQTTAARTHFRGTHSTWVPGAELRRWHHAESPAGAVGL